jgi:hypothetical protein
LAGALPVPVAGGLLAGALPISRAFPYLDGVALPISPAFPYLDGVCSDVDEGPVTYLLALSLDLCKWCVS